jgi:hypothetical protein
MRPHWDKVKDTLNALGYLVKRSDLDGIDLYFTNSAIKSHSRDRKKLMKDFKRAKPGGRSNMKVALSKILEQYRPEDVKYQNADLGRKLFSRKLKEQKWGLTVYVLTDGVWEDDYDELCGVHKPIATLVQGLTKYGMVGAQVGIQFIQFGNNEKGTRRLRSLDSGLRDFGIDK